MTMAKREMEGRSSIWSQLRPDADIDDLIFNYDSYHTREDEQTHREV